MYPQQMRSRHILLRCMLLLFFALFLLALWFMNLLPCLQRTDRVHYRLSIGNRCVTWNADTLRSALRRRCMKACDDFPVTSLGRFAGAVLDHLFSLSDDLRATRLFTALWDKILPYGEQKTRNAVFAGTLQNGEDMLQ